MSVKLRVEKAQLILMLSSTKAINNSIYPQIVDLVSVVIGMAVYPL